MIKHILKDGSCVDSVAGIVIRADQFESLYRMMEKIGGVSVSYKCTECGEKYIGEELSEWRSEHEQFSMHPFICPDCYDRRQRKDLEDQLDQLIGGNR